jgi:hypothetical protein
MASNVESVNAATLSVTVTVWLTSMAEVIEPLVRVTRCSCVASIVCGTVGCAAKKGGGFTTWYAGGLDTNGQILKMSLRVLWPVFNWTLKFLPYL